MAVAEPGADAAFYRQRNTNPFRKGDPRKACDFYFESRSYPMPDSATSATSSLYQSVAGSSEFSNSYCSMADGYNSQGPEIMPRAQDGLAAGRPSGPPRRAIPSLASNLPPRPSTTSSKSGSSRQELGTISDMGGYSPQLAQYSTTSVQSAPPAPGGRAGDVNRIDTCGRTPVVDFQAWQFSQYGAPGRKSRKAKKESLWKKLMFRSGGPGKSGSSSAESLQQAEQYTNKLPATDEGGYVEALLSTWR